MKVIMKIRLRKHVIFILYQKLYNNLTNISDKLMKTIHREKRVLENFKRNSDLGVERPSLILRPYIAFF